MRCIDDEIPFEIPENWEWCRLGSIVMTSGGKTPSTSNKSYWENGDILWVTSKDMKSTYISNSIKKLTPIGASDLKLLKSNTILIVVRSGILRRTLPVSILVAEATINQDLKSLTSYIDEGVPLYLYWSIIGNEEYILEKYAKDGTTVESLNFDKFLDFLIPIPPLSEQQRIVESIEQAFVLIDNIESDKSDLHKAIKQTKEKVLDLAIRGKLVPQDPNDEPASVLLERIKAEKQASAKGTKKQQQQPATTSDNSHYPFDIPDNWIWCKFGDISDYGKCLNAQPEQIDSDDWVLDLEDIEKDTGRVLTYITHKERKSASSKHIFKKGELLYSKLRPYLNKVVVAEFDGFCTSEIIPIDFKGYIVPKYGQVYLMSPFFLGYANILSYGVKMPRMGIDDGKKANIPLPPFAEQQRIVMHVSNVFKQLDNIEESLKA
ncbi:MAG: restriction endonuclease subunit S [Lachnospiraceae bacterium]